MTQEQEQRLLEHVAVIRADVKTIKATMITTDECRANRESCRREISNGTLTTWRDRAWRVWTIAIAVGLTGLVTFLVSRAGA